MTYRKTKRSHEVLAKMRAARDANRMASPAPDYPPVLPSLRRRIVIIDYDFGERTHTLDLYRMIGHANLGQLRTYYRESAERIAERL